MKKHNIPGRTVMCILAVSITALLASGCGSKTATLGSGAGQTAANNTAQNNNQPNGDDMKSQMQSNIDALVTAGTITKDQGDKILTALTANRPQNGNGQNGASDYFG